MRFSVGMAMRKTSRYTEFSDERLMQRVTEGDTGAFEELYDRYGPLVYGYIVRTIGRRTLAEELTQDVFVRVWKKAATYDRTRGKVVTWTMRITRNRVIDYFRAQKKALPVVSWNEMQRSAEVEDPEYGVSARVEREWVRRAVESLPESQREVLILAFFQGYTHREIAEALAQPLGTVKTRIRLAMKRLRVVLTDHGDRGDGDA
jgi:RNA polymerase sigma-70 factor (ECF subfamily)